MKRRNAAIAGFLTAPLVPPLAGVIFALASGEKDAFLYVGFLPIVYIFSAFAALLFGLPAFLLLFSVDMIRWWSTLGAGMVIGALVALILRYPSDIYIRDFLTMVPVGAASAFVFWLIWRQGSDPVPQDQKSVA